MNALSAKYVSLPQEFTFLLQSNMQTTGAGYSELKKSLWGKPSFQSMLVRTCLDIDSNLSFEKIITSLGWLGLRDRMAASYIHYQKYGVYPQSPSLDLIEDILSFENKVKGKTVDGYSRSFLYGFYKKMTALKEQKNTRQVNPDFSIVPQGVQNLLGLVKTRTAFIDWLCLTLESACEVHGEERVKKLIEAGGGFASMRQGLSRDQDYQLMRRYLSYGASIQHMDVFYNPTV
jgi:hypothetical protein